jgi:uncharacterized UPF0160 family protein
MKTIVTHNGQFHADEVVAIMMLREVFTDTKIIRSRDPDVISDGQIVVDVGSIYDPMNNKFDHHQKGCNESMDNKKKIPMSSAGMVYKKYGKDFIKSIYAIDSVEDLMSIYDQFYYQFIQEIDAIDNGLPVADKFNYHVNTNISSIINKMNGINIYNSDDQMDRFMRGMDYAHTVADIILNNIVKNNNTIKRDYKIISDSFVERFDTDSSGQILVINKNCNNWQKCIIDYEHNNNLVNCIKFIIYPSDNVWRIRAISHNFVTRKNLLPLDDLKKIMKGHQDITFIHNKLFIGSCNTLECAINVGKTCL